MNFTVPLLTEVLSMVCALKTHDNGNCTFVYKIGRQTHRQIPSEQNSYHHSQGNAEITFTI